LLLATDDGRHVAAVHAGWRGLEQGIPAAGVALLCEQAGCGPARLIAAVGPGIGAARYEIGPEVAARFGGEFLLPLASGRPGLDLQGVAVAQLAAAGVTAIDRVAVCTFDHPELFFSYRRDGAVCGRQAAVIRPNSA
jgi:copper oxidase (laccase) domain-containing protein